LKETFAQIRSQGYALDLEEFSIGLMCVAAPVFNFLKKEIGAVSISGPTHRVQDKGLEYFVSLVKKTAQQISQRLGYNGGNPADKAA
jgi:IclR family KDG regulon transcriptional repressor